MLLILSIVFSKTFLLNNINTRNIRDIRNKIEFFIIILRVILSIKL